MQEYRVFILDEEDTDFIQTDIENWGVYNNYHTYILDDAERFTVQAETSGEVFSLNGFQNALNREEINITNKFPVLSLLIELLIFPTFYYLTKTIQIDFKNLQIGFSKNQLKYYLLTFDISMAFYFILLQIFSIFTKPSSFIE